MGFLKEGDRVVISKGHVAAIVYAMLVEMGVLSQEDLSEYPGGRLCSHLHNGAPGVDVTTGSLGHGLGTAVGMAYRMRYDGVQGTVVCVMGDGECEEGSVWESAALAVKMHVDNVLVIVDCNGIGATDFVNPTGDLKRWSALGWRNCEVEGHSMPSLLNALEWAGMYRMGCPTVIVARTIKGHGVTFMENQPMWHSRVPKGDEVVKVMEALA